MRKNDFSAPRKFTFDEFYDLLKQFVNDPRVRELLATYDAEDAKGLGNLLDGSQCSDLAFESHSAFRMAGWHLLAKHGWPSYKEGTEMQDRDLWWEIRSEGDQLWRIGRRLIRKEPNEPWWGFQEYDFDIDDRDSVRSLLTMWFNKYGPPMPFTLE